MKNVVISATLSETQIEYLRNLAFEQGIEAAFFFEEEQVEELEQIVPHTPITGEIVDKIAVVTGKTPFEVYALASEHGVTTVQEALAIEGLPSEIAGVLEEYI